MPFTAAGSTTGAVLIHETYAPFLVEGVYKQSALLPLFGAPVDSGGGTQHSWFIHTTANSSTEVFTEGLAQPDPGQQEYVTASVSYKHFRGMLQFTGHAMDAMRSSYLPGIELEMSMLREDLMDLVDGTWLDAASGILAAVDESTAYAGLTRGSITYFESQETAVIAIVGYNDMIDMVEGVRDNDVGGITDLILCPLNQKTRIYNITGQPAIKQTVPSDAAVGYDGQTFAGIPVHAIGDMTDTVILFLDRRPGKWQVITHRPLQVKEMAPSGDSDIFQVSLSVNLIGRDMKPQGKLTGCTA